MGDKGHATGGRETKEEIKDEAKSGQEESRFNLKPKREEVGGHRGRQHLVPSRGERPRYLTRLREGVIRSRERHVSKKGSHPTSDLTRHPKWS